MSLLEPIRIPAYSQCFVECSVTTPVLRGTYLVEPNTPIFDTNGILVTRGIRAVCKHRSLSLIANVTANEVTLESNQILNFRDARTSRNSGDRRRKYWKYIEILMKALANQPKRLTTKLQTQILTMI